MSDHSDSSPLIAPAPFASPSEIDLEAGPEEQIQCRICLESDGRDFIAPCKCKGTSKYVHRDCLDHWRAVKEGFAFAHCTTCKAPYHLRVHSIADRKWRTLKFRFFVTRDVLFIFLAVQFVIAALAYLVYLIDVRCCSLPCWDYPAALSHVTIEEYAVILLSLVENFVFAAVSQGLHPCRMCADCHLPGTLCIWTDCTACFESCASAAGECGCLGGAGEAGLPIMFIMALVVLGLFTVVGIFYSVLVATMEYVVEDVDGEMTGSDWTPPPLQPEHIQQLKSLGLL
ncbi:unnamed protein product [Rhodiola kirilowii]